MQSAPDERAPGIMHWKHQHSGGIILVYQNNSQNTLHESLEFKVTGLEIEGHTGTNVEIVCAPGDVKTVKLNTTGGGYSFGLSVGY